MSTCTEESTKTSVSLTGTAAVSGMLKLMKLKIQEDTVDGRNPAPVEGKVVEIPLFFGFLYIPGGWPWDFWTINSTMGLWSLFMLKSMNVNHGERLRWFIWGLFDIEGARGVYHLFLHMVSYGLIGSNWSCWYTNPVNQLIQKKNTQTLTISFWTISGFCQSTVSHEQSKMYVFRFVR